MWGEALPLVLAIVLVGVLVALLVVTAVQSRRYAQQLDERSCAACGTRHPFFAVFCRQCGKRM